MHVFYYFLGWEEWKVSVRILKVSVSVYCCMYVRVTRVEFSGNKKFFTIGNWRFIRGMIVGMCLRSLTSSGVMITHTALPHLSEKLFWILKRFIFCLNFVVDLDIQIFQAFYAILSMMWDWYVFSFVAIKKFSQ